MTEEAQREDIAQADRSVPYTYIWTVMVRYENEDRWSLESAFPDRSAAVRAIEKFHRLNENPPIQWYSTWATEGHGEAENQPCPGFSVCEECPDWRGFVDDSGWYRMRRIALWSGLGADRWYHFIGVGEGPEGDPDYRPANVPAEEG
jgi:hypothetical protein